MAKTNKTVQNLTFVRKNLKALFRPGCVTLDFAYLM